jgi:hypothetical protein
MGEDSHEKILSFRHQNDNGVRTKENFNNKFEDERNVCQNGHKESTSF